MAAPSNSPVRVGLLGYGVAGACFHAPLIAATPNMRLAAVVTSDPRRQGQVRQEHPDAAVFAHAEQLWEQAGSVDVAVVATPNRTHAALTLAALDAGLPAVVDKPFATTAARARQLVAEAHRRGLMVTPFHNRRWDGDLLTVRRLIEAGELGGVLRFESRFERWRPTPKPGWRESGTPEDAGGVLNDLGSHLIDQALRLFGPVTRVYAELDRRRAGVRVDDDAFVALTHATGVRSHLWMSALAAQHGPRLRVLGDRAAYTKYGMDVQEEALRAGVWPGQPGWGTEPSERWGTLGAADDLRPVRTEPGSYQDFYRGVTGALREGGPPPVDPADAIAGLEIIEAARRSVTEAAPVAP